MHAHLALGVVLALTPFAAAQRHIATVFGPTVGGQTGDLVAAAGDLDGDNVPDFLVSSPYAGNGLVQIVSGATRTARNITNPVPGGWAGTTLIATADMNLDGVRDVVFERSTTLLAYSGATGALLWDTSGLGLAFECAAAIGDVNQDGRGDLAVINYASSNHYLRVLSGANGTLIPGFWPIGNWTNAILAIGDIDNDGRSEIARAGTNLEIFSVAPMAFLRSVPLGFAELAVADMGGTTRLELLGRAGRFVHVIDTVTGDTARTFENSADGRFAVLGDLDADGVPDLGWTTTPGNPGDAVDLRSGRTGAQLGRWLGRAGFRCVEVAGVGDVDGDGFGDLLIGDNAATAVPPAQATGGWQLVSGKLLATMTPIPVHCAQGPWFPQLGVTRPVLGSTATIEGRDRPAGTAGVLALSRQPAFPFNFGVVGCDGWWDVTNWVMLTPPAGTSWQLPMPIPNAPQLAGLDVALQSFYLPTSSPIGFDLSNAVWARLGY